MYVVFICHLLIQFILFAMDQTVRHVSAYVACFLLSNYLLNAKFAPTERLKHASVRASILTAENPFRTIPHARVVSSMVEQRTLNPLVIGSSPIRPTDRFSVGSLAQSAEHLTFNQGVTGSSPVRPTRLKDERSSAYTSPEHPKP